MPGEFVEQSFSFIDRIRNGMLTPDQAIQESDRHSGTIIGRTHTEVRGGKAVSLGDVGDTGEGIAVELRGGGRIDFINSAAALDYVRNTGGVIRRQNPDGTSEIAFGEDPRDKLQRLGKI